MDTLSQTAATVITLNHLTSSPHHRPRSCNLLLPTRQRVHLSKACSVRAVASQERREKEGGGIVDFNDPGWKSNYEREFAERFNLPHISDIFPHAPSIPSTFCLKMRFSLFLLLLFSFSFSVFSFLFSYRAKMLM